MDCMKWTARSVTQNKKCRTYWGQQSLYWLALFLWMLSSTVYGQGVEWNSEVTVLEPGDSTSTEEGPVVFLSSMIMSGSVFEDSPDISVFPDPSTTQSENSVFIDPNNPLVLLNSNNSTTWPVTFPIYGADAWVSLDGGQTWTGSVLGAGGPNKGDPATAIDLNGRMYVGFIATDGGQGIAYTADTGQTWTSVQVAPGGGLDKNHLWVDNSPGSPFEENLYSSWTTFQGGAAYGEIEISRSTTSGLSWSPKVIISDAVNAGNHNQGVNVQVGPNGEAYVVWSIYDSWPSDETALGFVKSVNGGQSWPDATRILTNIRGHRITPLGGGKTMRHNSFPSMTVNQQTGQIFIVWTNIGVPGVNTGDPDIYLISSVDDGNTWSTPIRVNQDSLGNGKDQYLPWMACDPVTGLLACVFYDSRNFPGNDMVETFVAISQDNGQTWEDFGVSDVAWSGDGFLGSYAGDYLGIATRNNKVYPMWSDDRTGNMLVYVSPFNLGVPPHIVSVSPTQNELNVPLATNISVTFDVDMDATTLNSSTFVVNARSTGLHQGTITFDGPTKTATFDPASDFDAGEVVSLTLTTGIQSAGGIPLDSSFVWSFTIDVNDESPGSFAPDSAYTVGDQPISVFAGDFDGDGDLDLASASITSDSVSILLNNGDATFATHSNYLAGNGLRSVYAGDLDGDGDLDLAIAILHSNSIAILLNNGNGTFAPPSEYSVQNRPYSVFGADLDGDGDLDLASADFMTNGTVSVILNNGDGTFGPHTAYSVGNAPISVFAADFDGDGDLDLASANRDTHNVSVLLNNGDGTFAPHSVYSVGSSPLAIFAADFDGDGDVDLATANQYSDNISVLLNNGDGTFAAQTVYTVGVQPRSVFAADFDGDGDIDLATTNWNSNNVSVLFNNGNNTFAPHMVYPVGQNPWGIFAADLDGDGDLDLATTDDGFDQVSILLNQVVVPQVIATSPAQNELCVPVATDISVTFDFYMEASTINGSTFIVNARSTGLHQGTFTYDGPTKTATFDPSSDFDEGEVITVVLTTGIQSSFGIPLDSSYIWSFTVDVNDASPGTFSYDSAYSVGARPRSVFAADLDGDGDLDLTTSNLDSDNISVLLNNGDATFAFQSVYAVGDRPNLVFAADFDGDGDLDLVTTHGGAFPIGDSTVAILLNNGDGTFAPQTVYQAGGGGLRAVFAADLDGDGDLDLAVGSRFDDNVSILLNNGAAIFSLYAVYSVGEWPMSVVAADLDGDGDLDMAVANRESHNAFVFFNNGDATFGAPDTLTVGTGPYSIVAADVDADGDLDLTTANAASDNVSVLFNNGDGTFAAQVTYQAGDATHSVFAADLDGDCDLDLTTANRWENDASVLMNNGNGTFVPHVVYSVGLNPSEVFAADLDGDGDLDLAIAEDNASGTVSILLNRPVNPPNAPILVSPSDGSSTTDHTPTLTWNAVTGYFVDVYEVWVDNNSDFSSPEHQPNNITGTQWTTPLLASDWWYWRVRAHNEAGWGTWSATRSLQVYTSGGGCPILFSYDGNDFVENNPLLTACEASGYVDIVTDYYLVRQSVVPQQGQVTFQLRETVDEITYLYELELITVDHSDRTRVACSVDGQISTFTDAIPPLSAVDHNGVDQLSALLKADGQLVKYTEPGYLIVSFANTDDSGSGFQLTPVRKFFTEKVTPDGLRWQESDLTVEVLGADGNWHEYAIIPPREHPTLEVLLPNLKDESLGETVTLRLSWTSHYTVDVIFQFVPSNEESVLKKWPIKQFDLTLAKTNEASSWSGFDGITPLILAKGDQFEFSFASDEQPQEGIERDYIIRAVGRYEPDYSAIANLLPNSFQLQDNYPNPFNPTTTIGYHLPIATHVKLEIYNVLGQRVGLVVDEVQEAGQYTVKWDGRDDSGVPVSSGIYFYRLTTADFVDSKKMMLLK